MTAPSRSERYLVAPRDELLRPSDLEAQYGVNEGTQKTWRRRGVGPRWFNLGPRRVVYRRSDVDAWVATQEQATARGGAS